MYLEEIYGPQLHSLFSINEELCCCCQSVCQSISERCDKYRLNTKQFYPVRRFSSYILCWIAIFRHLCALGQKSVSGNRREVNPASLPSRRDFKCPEYFPFTFLSLCRDGLEVAVVYYRSGYVPQHYTPQVKYDECHLNMCV